jgi:hypothetical protein
MAVCMSSGDIARLAADAPTGSIAKDMAIASARMVRTNRMNIDLPFGPKHGLSTIFRRREQSLFPLKPS